MIRTMVFLTDFLNAVTLLYLFYCQARAQQKEAGHTHQRSRKKDSQDKYVTFSTLIQESEDDLKVDSDFSKELSEDNEDYNLAEEQVGFEANVNQFQNYLIKLARSSSDLY